MRPTIIGVMLFVAASAFFAQAAHAATPTYANNGASCSNTQLNAAADYQCRLPNTTRAGNALIVFVQSGTTITTSTVTDNASDTFSQAVCATGNQRVCAYISLNVSSTARVIDIALPTSTQFVSAAAYEFYNVATSSALDGTCTGGSATATSTIACGTAITPTVGNDLILFWAAQDGVTPSAVTTTWTAGASPWVLRTADRFGSTGMEYQVAAATSSITPSMTMAPANAFDAVGLALKSAAAGTAPPAGIRVAYVQHEFLPANANGCNATSSCTGPVTAQFPCAGNLVLASWIGFVSGYDITNVTSTPANTWTSTGAAFGNPGSPGSGDNQIYYAANATCAATTTITLTIGTSTDATGSTLQLFDVVGAASSPFDATAGRQTCSGNQTVAGSNVTGCTITPTTANGLVITQIGIASNGIIGVSPGNFLSTLPTPYVANDQTDQLKGWGINYNANTSAETFTWTTAGGPVGLWASIAAAFEAPAATSTALRKIRVIGISR